MAQTRSLLTTSPVSPDPEDVASMSQGGYHFGRSSRAWAWPVSLAQAWLDPIVQKHFRLDYTVLTYPDHETGRQDG
jgi:hypothetical protein